MESPSNWSRFKDKYVPNNYNLPSLPTFLLSTLILLPILLLLTLFVNFLVLEWSNKAIQAFGGDGLVEEGSLRFVNMKKFANEEIDYFFLPKIQHKCSTRQFECEKLPVENVTRKIAYNRRCDGVPNCLGGSDEKNCKECQTHFSCPSLDGLSLICVRAEQLCDGIADCPRAEDELLKYCKKYTDDHAMFAINCALNDSKCELKYDDFDIQCGEDEFKCRTRCIPKEYHCDGEIHCPGFLWPDDEHHCEKCNGNAVFCKHPSTSSGSCIPPYMLCDQIPDCLDHSDEQFFHCESIDECPGACNFENDDREYKEIRIIRKGNKNAGFKSRIDEQQVQCSNGQWINIAYACSGNYPQCDSACPKCTMGGFRCLAEERCLNSSAVCDGIPDCIDGADELACTNVTGSCDEDFRLCNGFPDCKDGHDELNCTKCKEDTELKLSENPLFKALHWETNKAEKAFHCKKDQKCISLYQRCDGEANCSDGEDEEECTCNECLKHPWEMYICQKGMRCFQWDQVCDNGMTKCPNATKLDQEFCSNQRLH